MSKAHGKKKAGPQQPQSAAVKDKQQQEATSTESGGSELTDADLDKVAGGLSLRPAKRMLIPCI